MLLNKSTRRSPEEEKRCVQIHRFASTYSPQNSNAGRPSVGAPPRIRIARRRGRGGTFRGWWPGTRSLPAVSAWTRSPPTLHF